MADPITTDDLYGKSTNEPVTPPPVAPPEAPNTTPPPKPLTYEETPEVPLSKPTEPKKKSGCMGTILTGIIFLALFIGGIWLASFARQFFSTSTETVQPEETSTSTTTTVRPTSGTTATGSAVVAGNKTYDVISGTTKTSFGGVTYQLPGNVLAPICDGSGCASQGTYLPGGTRLTVAPRGAGQALADFRGSVISDVGGITFTTKPTTVAGKAAMEFTGVFAGRTISGYGFSRMRGVMIELTPTTSLEVNHFTPNGVTADFAADDVVFDAILKTIKIGVGSTVSVTPSPIKTITPTPTTVQVATPTATPAGN
jgi:hypothetical protein